MISEFFANIKKWPNTENIENYYDALLIMPKSN
jgi:hypothetical protein